MPAASLGPLFATARIRFWRRFAAQTRRIKGTTCLYDNRCPPADFVVDIPVDLLR